MLTTMATGNKRYKIIYADPPWEFKTWSEKGRCRTENHYHTMPLDKLMDLPVPDLCDGDCVLLMWATFPCLGAALDLGKHWGFEFKTVAFVWVKLFRNNGKVFFGLGHYTRANAEIVLLFTKGKPLKRQSKKIGQVVITRVGAHSQKPAEVRERIVRLFGDLPRLELFARSRKGFFPDHEYEGWDVFGKEVNGSINLEGA
jgi:N6-adenosine-specific RNA methylase IME4